MGKGGLGREGLGIFLPCACVRLNPTDRIHFSYGPNMPFHANV